MSLIVAMTEQGVIGRGNTLPWHLPNDLKRFKQLTLGKPIVMGRKTFDSIGRPLPERTNIVITRQGDLRLAGCVVVNSLSAALAAAEDVHSDELMIIGGAEIYRQALPQVQRIHQTRVHAQLAGDAYFPELSAAQWRELAREDHAADARHAYDYSFITLERCS